MRYIFVKIANILKFTYTIQKVRDNAYGSKESNGKWSGMVGELQRGDADLAVASLTISYGRSEVIDFTVPYMHLGISILFKKPRITDSDWFKFMDPLSTQVWIMTFASYFVVSIAIWIIAKISPYEQFERDEDNGQYKPVDNQFSLRNSFWFTVCSLMQQGSELCPRAASTRLLTGIWWFFALILISSYTANLAAVLTTRRMETPIENADDLAAQTKIKYGTLGRGSTMSFFNVSALYRTFWNFFFQESKIETYERMWQLMSSSPGLFVQSSKEGIARVKSSDYAYLMESSMLEYAVERDCELMQIGGLIDQKGYGIGLPKGSPYRELISTAILRLQEKTELTELKEKWWKDKSVVCEQPKRKDQDDGESIGGIFIILVVGLVLTAVLVIFELITTRKPSPAQSQVIRHVNVIPTFKFEFFR
ncbi:CRE-GLR-3 protein [Caenorhabditis remanei]|uniref:CRE-GLR-3 protein n=1 Tax=Caenorhabditis remanei TaxID=31234 RepID=E3NI25_CAERE|nr:CRE-GLR-3 protein [Caenorhabditis remanei]